MRNGKQMRQVVIVGAGLGGLCAAIELSNSGLAVTVVDGADHVGGLLRSESIDGLDFDYGTHFIIETHSAEANRQILDEFVLTHQPRLFHRSLSEGHFFKGRLNEATGCPDLRVLSSGKLKKARDEFLKSVDPLVPSSSAHDWAVNRYGKMIVAEFYTPAVQKLTGTGLHELDASIINFLHMPRVVLFDSEATYKLKQNPWHDSRLAYTRTSDGESDVRKYYPLTGGIGTWPEYLRATAESRGVTFRLGAHVESVSMRTGQVAGLRLQDGDVLSCDDVIWTVQPEALLRSLGEVLGGSRPEFRDVQLHHYRVFGDYATSSHWVTNYEPGFASYRTTLYENFAPSLGAEASRLTVESLTGPGSSLLDDRRLARELCESRIIHDPDQVALVGTKVLSRALPIPSVGSLATREQTVRRAASVADNLHLAGAGNGAHGQVAVIVNSCATANALCRSIGAA